MNRFLGIAFLLTLTYNVFSESTSPLLNTYLPNDYKGDYQSSPQNMGMIQSTSGIMYFANPSGILEFDGESWKMVTGSYGLQPRAFTKNSEGTIFVGGYNNLGLLHANEAGQIEFHSLTEILDEFDRDFGTIDFVLSIDTVIYFVAGKQLMKFSNNKFKVWKTSTHLRNPYILNNEIYLKQDNVGLMKLKGDSLITQIKNEKISIFDMMNYFSKICPCDKETLPLVDNDANGNFLMFNGNKYLVKLDKDANEFLSLQRGYLKTGVTSTQEIVIGTLSGGAIIIDNNGKLVRSINKSLGLPDNIINAVFIDKQDGLWMGHDKGISRFQLNSPLNFIAPSSGYSGIIVSIVRYNKKLYISTTDGVFVEKSQNHLGYTEFKRFEPIKGQSFTLLDFKNFLLVASIYGVFQIEENKIKKITDGVTVSLLRSTDDRLYTGMVDGIKTLQFNNSNWVEKERLSGFRDVAYYSTITKENIIWTSNQKDKLYRIDVSGADTFSPVVVEFDTSNGLPLGWIFPVVIENEIFFGSYEGVYQYNETQKSFHLSENSLFNYFNKNLTEAGPIAQDPDGNIWVVSNGKAGKLIKEETANYRWDSTATMNNSDMPIWSIYFDDDSIVWLGTTEELIRYDTRVKQKNIESFPTHIRKVTLDEDSVIFFGSTLQTANQFPQIDFASNDLHFEYAAPFYEGQNQYSVKLEGEKGKWSDWTTETKIRYTHLSPGKYTFWVKAKNIYAFEGQEASFSFIILPPFYLTWWAFIFYAFLFGMIIWAFVVFNSRRLVAAKRKLEAIVVERNQELIETNEELKRAKEFEEQFLANMSHEVRTPMNSVVGMTNLLLKSDPNPQQSKYLKAIKQSADNLLVIINDILDISKIQAGKLEIEEIDFSVKEVIDIVVETLRLKIEDKGLFIKTEISSEVPKFVKGDSVRLNQILLNLIGNAVKFTSTGGITVTCEVFELREPFIRLKFSVSDTGIGIPAEKINVIFKSFGQAGKDITRKFGGTGLGLAISKQLVEMQRGNIHVNSQQGKGTTFYFDILYVIADEFSEEETKQQPIQLENLNILLAEDNEFNQMVAKDTLESLIKNVNITIANNGKEAVDQAAKEPYDLILMDINMPVMDGCEAARQIRVSVNNKVKIMAMTASATEQEQDDCKSAGIDDLIIKPFSPEDLLQKINHLINNNGTNE